jgi:redox-sensitive bicupin YhaK (pirin superfamily)
MYIVHISTCIIDLSVTISMLTSDFISSYDFLFFVSIIRPFLEWGVDHTFTFADYYDPKYKKFDCLRVINEDRVAGGQGFPTHPHQNYEIFSYVISGTLRHKDNLGTDESMNRGDIQMTTAGLGVQHSEFNANPAPASFVHFLQVWCTPLLRNVKPQYQWRHFDDKEKINNILPIITQSGNNGDAIKINSEVDVYASLLGDQQTVTHPLRADREYYIHVAQNVIDLNHEIQVTSLLIDNGDQQYEIQAGDGVYIRSIQESDAELKITGLVKDNEGNNGRFKYTEFLLFDLKKQ